MNPFLLWALLGICWCINTLAVWMHYLDIRTTFKGESQKPGLIVESNAAMAPYLKPWNYGLAVWGKLLNGAWIVPADILGCIVSIWVWQFVYFAVLIAPIVAYEAWDTWKNAVKSNEKLDNANGVVG